MANQLPPPSVVRYILPEVPPVAAQITSGFEGATTNDRRLAEELKLLIFANPVSLSKSLFHTS